jgi:thioredoxin reductase
MHHDVIIIGGSFAGLSAAMYLARARRSVCVVDAGEPRNRFAAHSHGFFAQDGSSPAAMLATARRQVAAYPTVSFVAAHALRAESSGDRFAVALDTGETLTAARLVLAFGVADELPPIPGLAERWGNTVLHCPYCHGYEFSGRRLGVLDISPMSVHQAMLIAEWGPTTFYLNGGVRPDGELLAELEARKIAVEPARVVALRGDGASLTGIELADGRTVAGDALYIRPVNSLNSDIAEQLGCAIETTTVGRIIQTDDERRTTVPNVYAAGDVTRGAHNVSWAVADGVTAALAIHRSFVF